MVKFLAGFVLCALIALLFVVAYSKTKQAKELIAIEKQTIDLLKNPNGKIPILSEDELNIKINAVDEKINSVNKRFDDLYLLGGTIVTLLLAINIGIFLRTQAEVDRYFKKNFEAHLGRITDYEKQAAEQLGKITTYVASLETKNQVVEQEPNA